MYGGFIGIAVFIVYAIKTPLTSKLYKEAFYSYFIGCTLASSYPYYYRKQYLQSVSVAYDALKARFQKFPHLNVPDSENISKNFGSTRWNDSEVSDDEDLLAIDSQNVFDGRAVDTRSEMVSEFLE